MAAPQQLPLELSASIERCAAALGDLSRLKGEVQALKQTGDGMAHFASALFELELARQGDVESRMNISDLAEVLLVFWSDGSGDELSRLHPALESQWQAVAPMLVQFELKRLEMVLGMCWKHRQDPAQLQRDLEDLAPEGNRRVEFARCLYHLELVRQGVQASRAEFARRVGLLSEAYQDTSFANDLVGQDPGLIHLWAEVKPYLDEFFEAMEEQQARAMDATRRVQMPVAPPEAEPPPPMDATRRVQMPVAPPEEPPPLEPPARRDVKTDPSIAAPPEFAEATPTPRGGQPAIDLVPTPPGGLPVAMDAASTPRGGQPAIDLVPTPPGGLPALMDAAPTPRGGQPAVPPPPPAIAPVPPGRTALGDSPNIPSFRSLFSSPPPGATPAPPPPARMAPPPPPPSNLTPPGSWVPEPDVVIDEATEAPPPPPPAIAPSKSPSQDELDIVEADFEAPVPPPPPAVTPAKGLPAAMAAAEDVEFEFEPTETALAFWDYTFASLQQAPVEGVKPRMLATESRQDRKRLTTWLEGLGPHLAVPEAKAFAALVRLMLAGETKEKSLFGQANPRRKEALGAAFSLLAPTPESVGKAAVWFVLDGAETEQAFMRGLDLLYPFLAFCARHALDPCRPETVSAYLEQA